MKKTSKRTGESPQRSRARPRRTRTTRSLPLEDALVAFADLAARIGLRWYVFGAQAVSFHGFPRATADLDLTIDLARLTPRALLDEVQLHRIGNRRVPVLSPENLIVTKLLAARPKDLEDVRELVASRDSSLDHERINELLALLEQALGQSDLLPLYQQLRDEAARR